jgi:hypothetical protein
VRGKFLKFSWKFFRRKFFESKFFLKSENKLNHDFSQQHVTCATQSFVPTKAHNKTLPHQFVPVFQRKKRKEIKLSHFLPPTNPITRLIARKTVTTTSSRAISIIYKQTMSKKGLLLTSFRWRRRHSEGMSEQHFLMWILREIYDYDKFLMPFFLTHTHKITLLVALSLFAPFHLSCYRGQQKACTITYWL